MNSYLKEFPPDKEGQETAPLPTDEIMDIIYHSMPTTWNNKMIEQCFNYTDSTIKEMAGFFETRVENLEPKEDKKKSSTASKKAKKSTKKNKREDSDSSVVESSKESAEARRPSKKYCTLHKKCIQGSTCYDQQAQTKEKRKISGTIERATSNSII